MIRYLVTATAVLSGIASAMSVVPYGWAHITAAAITAGITTTTIAIGVKTVVGNRS